MQIIGCYTIFFKRNQRRTDVVVRVSAADKTCMKE